jgi:hypothetical protein
MNNRTRNNRTEEGKIALRNKKMPSIPSPLERVGVRSNREQKNEESRGEGRKM